MMGVLEGEEKKQEIENLFEKIMKENFPNLVKEIDIIFLLTRLFKSFKLKFWQKLHNSILFSLFCSYLKVEMCTLYVLLGVQILTFKSVVGQQNTMTYLFVASLPWCLIFEMSTELMKLVNEVLAMLWS